MIVELRRYVITPGERDNFAQHFESYFPEAFQQLAARVALAAAAERAQALVNSRPGSRPGAPARRARLHRRNRRFTVIMILIYRKLSFVLRNTLL